MTQRTESIYLWIASRCLRMAVGVARTVRRSYIVHLPFGKTAEAVLLRQRGGFGDRQMIPGGSSTRSVWPSTCRARVRNAAHSPSDWTVL